MKEMKADIPFTGDVKVKETPSGFKMYMYVPNLGPVKQEPPKDPEADTTPSLPVTFDIEHDGKTRKAEMTDSGLYVFDKGEEFEPNPPEPEPEKGLWVANPAIDRGQLIVSGRGPTKTLKTKGAEALWLTKKAK